MPEVNLLEQGALVKAEIGGLHPTRNMVYCILAHAVRINATRLKQNPAVTRFRQECSGVFQKTVQGDFPIRGTEPARKLFESSHVISSEYGILRTETDGKTAC